MNRLWRRRTDSTYRKRLWDFLWITVITFRFSLIIRDSKRWFTLMMGWTCPWNPVVPDSISGTSAARHILFTCLRASILADSHIIEIPKLSNALKTMSNDLKNVKLNSGSLMFAWRASSFTRGLKRWATSFATWVSDRYSYIPTKAFDFLIWAFRKRNWRFKFDKSIVSRSTYLL